MVIMLMIPFLLATSFFGLTASLFFTDSDAPLLMIAFFSVGLIFLSGVSYPIELMPWYWKMAPLSHSGSPSDNGLCQAELDGGFDERDTIRIYYPVGTVRVLFRDGMFGL